MEGDSVRTERRANLARRAMVQAGACCMLLLLLTVLLGGGATLDAVHATPNAGAAPPMGW